MAKNDFQISVSHWSETVSRKNVFKSLESNELESGCCLWQLFDTEQHYPLPLLPGHRFCMSLVQLPELLQVVQQVLLRWSRHRITECYQQAAPLNVVQLWWQQVAQLFNLCKQIDIVLNVVSSLICGFFFKKKAYHIIQHYKGILWAVFSKICDFLHQTMHYHHFLATHI